jgi:hypothetical protein
MAIATDEQVQQYVNTRVRPRSEQIRALYNACKDDKAAGGDIYEALIQPNPTWEDEHDGNPPHYLTPNDVLAWNTFISGLITFVEGKFPTVEDANYPSGQYPIVEDACVRPLIG